ncbi:MAG: excinuclease ABC subunit UvrC [Desulfovibrionaceae bacterium]
MAEYKTKGIDLTLLTPDPGVYLFKDHTNKVLYVGKARSLRKRLSSYFRGVSTLAIKTQRMLAKAQLLDVITTTTEKEALLLEASLIKRHKPKYNIVLRDDKAHLMFCIRKNTKYPRLEIVRKIQNKKDTYFGPFVSASGAKQTWKVLHGLFPLRRCTDRVLENRTRPCLYYHIGSCLAPCTEEVSEAIYDEYIYKIELFLSGKTTFLLEKLEREMKEYSNRLEYEKAMGVRDQISIIRRTIEHQVVILDEKIDMDIIGICEVEAGLGLSIVFVREGRVIDTLTFFFASISLEESQDVLYSFLSQYYNNTTYIPEKILVPYIALDYQKQFLLLEEIISEYKEDKIYICAAQTRIENQLLDIAIANAKQVKTSDAKGIGERLALLLGSEVEIETIEVVDVSHLSGEQTRVGVLRYEKSDNREVSTHRVYKIESAGGDDYKALSEWIQRRLKDESIAYPDLLLIDGGKGQLSTVEKYVRDDLGELRFHLMAITKARREDGRPDRRAGNISDRLFIPGRSNALHVKEGSEELLFLQYIRDRAHDFVIGKHRRAHRKEMLESELLRIKGIGKAIAKKLLDAFGSIHNIAESSIESISSIQGISIEKAEEIKNHLTRIYKKQ